MVGDLVGRKSLVKECGGIGNAESCERVMCYSPYSVKVGEELKAKVLVFFSAEESCFAEECYKFAGKLRESLKDDAVIVKDFMNVTENEKYAYILAFLINSLTKS